jgi:hypothetical protein
MSNMVCNLTITLDDVKIAEKVFGPDVGALKGKIITSKNRKN